MTPWQRATAHLFNSFLTLHSVLSGELLCCKSKITLSYSQRVCSSRCIHYHQPTFWSQRIGDLVNLAHIAVQLGGAYGGSYSQAIDDTFEIGLFFATIDQYHFSCTTISVDW